MIRTLLTLLIAAISAIGLYAQDTAGSKILVFRNTGEINILDSDSISKVELSVFDTDSIAHDEFVSQVFHHRNSKTLTVPLAEIDSVAFGYRNIIEPKKGVRRLTDEEAEAITSFDGETLIYDSRLTLKAGEIVYYDLLTEVLPIALCVKVNSVTDDSGIHKADVIMLDPSDVFDRFLITGNIEEILANRKTRAEDYTYEPFELDLPELDANGARIEGKAIVKFDIDNIPPLSEVVINPIQGYYHALVSFHIIPYIDFKMHSLRPIELHPEIPYDYRPKLNIPPLPTPSPLRLTIAFDLFVDLLAELGIEYELSTDYNINVEWTCRNGENIFSNPQTGNEENVESHQKIEAHIAGEIFGGPRTDISIHLPFRILGAGFEVKLGQRIRGELSTGILSELSHGYTPELYAKGEIYMDRGLKMETYVFNSNLRNPSQLYLTKLPFEFEKYWDSDTIRLFPEFNSRAVLARATAPIVQTGNEPEAVSISTFIEEELPCPLDISFEIADKETDETLAETEVIDTLEKENEEYQNVYTDIIVPSSLGKIDTDAVFARPIINYKGYKIKAAPTPIAGGMALTPNICSLASGGSFFVSGMTPVSQRDYEEKTYIEGNLVGVIKGDHRYKKRKFKMYDFIDISDPHKCNGQHGATYSLLGNWEGTIAGESVRFTFAENQTGTYNETPFTYKLNSPQRGGIAIQLKNGGTISFSITDISDETLTIIMKGSEDQVILNRK